MGVERRALIHLSVVVCTLMVLLAGCSGLWPAQRDTLELQSSSSFLPVKTPLGNTALFEPGGAMEETGDGGAQGFHFAVIDPANGVTAPEQPFASNTLVSTPWMASGNELVDVVGLQDEVGVPNIGTAVALVPGQPQLTRSLGPASYVTGASTPGELWLVVDPGYADAPNPESGCTVEEVSLAGTVVASPHPFPCGSSIEGPSPHGLLIDRAGLQAMTGDQPGTLSTWDPLTAHTEASYGGESANLTVDGDSSDVALWNECPNSPCVDRVTDLDSGPTRVLPEPPSGWNQISPYALSPDGRFAAVLAISDATQTVLKDSSLAHSSPPCCYVGVHAVPSELLLYNVRTDALVEARPLMAASDPLMRWSPDGGWLFVTRDLQHIEAVPAWTAKGPVRIMRTGGRGFGPNTPSESFLPFSR